jgi:Cft2 family RNA processing exonuclease
MKKPNYGIAFIGYQDPNSPGHALLNSEEREAFDFGGKKVSRSCSIAKLRFSAHASKSGLVQFISEVKPSTVAIIHGDPEACDALALSLKERMPGVRVLIPTPGKTYTLFANV